MRIRRVICAVFVMVVLGLSIGSARAVSTYPTRPIRLIVPFPAGGASDVVARLLAAKMGTELGQSVIVENRSGASTAIGTQVAARSAPDGYTILLVTGTCIIAPLLQAVPYSIDKDFVRIIGIGSGPLVLAVPSASDIRSIPDLVAASRQPRGISFAYGGNGSMAHLAGSLLNQELKLNATPVSYRGNAPALQDLITNRVQFFFPTVSDVLELSKAGQVRLLAVTSGVRVPDLPNVPTTKELGFPQINPQNWYGFVAPTGTPPEIVDRLHDAFADAIAQPDVQERLRALVFIPHVTSGAELGKFIQAERARWKKVIADNNIKGDQ